MTSLSVIVSPPSLEEEDWDQFADADNTTDEIRETTALTIYEDIAQFPPQLHPAVSLGIRRVSSCYLSIGSDDESNNSIADFLSMWDEASVHEDDSTSLQWTDILYHDILMHVFTFLNAQSLAAFSETARRPNFEVFYYLQLQLQRALLVDHSHHQNLLHQPNTPSIAGSSYLSRLALLHAPQAQETVYDFLQSNSTLRTMPLSHSLAYIRHVLQRNGFPHSSTTSPPRALASAALFMTVVGAAFMTGEAAVDSFGTELPNMLFRVGFVGSLMGAARQTMNQDNIEQMKDTAEHMARSMQQLPGALFGSPNNTTTNANTNDARFPSLARVMQVLSTMMPSAATLDAETKHPLSPNPYEHLPAPLDSMEEKKEEAPEPIKDKKMPSGCVGAYSRAIQNAATRVTHIVKEQRKARFAELTPDEQHQTTTAFLEACHSDESLPIVKQMIHLVDVDAFYLGSDGTETCALHTAAFNGAARILDFLCQSIDASDASNDGGLASVHVRDANGWTALHFAAGANSVAVARVLVKHGAELMTVEANNGYTPLQWAERLSNDSVAEFFRDALGVDQPMGWMSRQPLSMIANRFFSLIPSH